MCTCVILYYYPAAVLRQRSAAFYRFYSLFRPRPAFICTTAESSHQSGAHILPPILMRSVKAKEYSYILRRACPTFSSPFPAAFPFPDRSSTPPCLCSPQPAMPGLSFSQPSSPSRRPVPPGPLCRPGRAAGLMGPSGVSTHRPLRRSFCLFIIS